MVRSESEATLSELLEGICGQHHNDARGLFLFELRQQVHAVDSGQLNVQDNGIGPVLAKERLGLKAIRRFTDYNYVGTGADQGDQPFPNNGRVLYDKNRDQTGIWARLASCRIRVTGLVRTT